MEKFEPAKRIKQSTNKGEEKKFVFRAYRETCFGDDLELDEDLWKKLINIDPIRRIFELNQIMGFIRGSIGSKEIRNNSELIRTVNIVIYDYELNNLEKKRKKSEKQGKLQKKVFKILNNPNNKTIQLSYPNIIKFKKDLNKIEYLFKKGKIDIILDKIVSRLEGRFDQGKFSFITKNQNFYVLFDTNFLVGKEKKEPGYEKFHEIIKGFTNNTNDCREMTTEFINMELKGSFSKSEELDTFEKEKSFLDKGKKNNIIKNLELVYFAFDFILDLIEEVKLYKETKSESLDYQDEFHNLYRHLAYKGFIKEQFGRNNKKFFWKIRHDLNRKDSSPLIVDSLIVFLSMILAINADPVRCLIISDDSDMQILSEILFDNILAKYITKIVCDNYKFENENDFSWKMIGFENKFLFKTKVQQKVLEYLDIHKRACTEPHQTSVGLIFSPKSRVLYESFLSQHLMFMIRNLDEIKCGVTNMFAASAVLDIDFMQANLINDIYNRFYKKTNELIVIGKTKKELLEIMK